MTLTLMRLLLALIASSIGLSHVAGAQMLTVHHEGIPHSELIAPNNSEFDSLRAAILAGAGLTPASNDRVQKLRPVSILLRNKHTVPMIAYAIDWKIRGQSGETRTLRKIYWHRSALLVSSDNTFGKNHTQTRNIYASHAVPENGTRLITPFFNLSTSSDSANTSAASDFVGDPRFESEMLAARSIDVALDSAVYADGSSEGPDTLNLCTRINGEMEGIDILLERAVMLRKTGSSATQVLDELVQQTQSSPEIDFPRPSATVEEWSQFARQQFVRELSRVRRVSGDQVALDLLYTSPGHFRVQRSPSHE